MNALLFISSNASGFVASVALTSWMHFLIYAGAIVLVAGIVVLWAVLFRKKPREPRYQYRRAQPTDVAANSVIKSAAAVSSHKGDRRRRRRSEPRRNPTLAETRGLPPVRDEQPAPTEHYQH